MIRDGLEFALKHDLTKEQIRLVLAIIDGPKTVKELMALLKKKRTGIYNPLLVLQYKGLVEIMRKNDNNEGYFTLVNKIRKEIESSNSAPINP